MIGIEDTCNRPKNDNIRTIDSNTPDYLKYLQQIYTFFFVVFTSPDCEDCVVLESSVQTIMRNAPVSMNNVFKINASSHHVIHRFTIRDGQLSKIVYIPKGKSRLNLQEFMTVNPTCPVIYDNIERTITDVESLNQLRADYRAYIIIYTKSECQKCIKWKETISEIQFKQPLFALKVFEFALPYRPATSSVQSPQVSYMDEIALSYHPAMSSVQSPPYIPEEIDPTSVKDVPSIVKYIYNPLRGSYQSFQYKSGDVSKEALERFMTHSLWDAK